MWLPLLLLVLVLILLYRWHRQSQILQNISDKYVLITGCDTGFGNLLAKQLDQLGLLVLAACLTEKGAEGLKKETSTRVQTVILDVSDNQSVSSAAEWTTRIVGDSGILSRPFLFKFSVPPLLSLRNRQPGILASVVTPSLLHS
ncbi:retinol dehydrogenase 3-like [Pelobates cultripes]|uniref:Retinol dehydrogenase 3-like n=1 Tax=Pelobates cultripes TaxID=61616 RepID=A0AAD1R5U0_PELCU|nr:retinol dehydrogenase 3-like [Pelobates cultripes]